MIIKTFTADSMAAALKLVRSELGKDSVVLKSREVPAGISGGRVEITACTDRPLPVATTPVATTTPVKPVVAQNRATVKPFAPQAVTNRLQASTLVSPQKPNATPVQTATQIPAPDPLAIRLEKIEATLNRLAVAPESRVANSQIEAVRSTLRYVDIQQSIIDELLGSIISSADVNEVIAQVRAQLTERLSGMTAPSIDFQPGDRVLFYGPAGSGKTSALGKLAARLVFQEKKKVTLVSLDTLKIGAIEEIQSYGDIIGSLVESHETAVASTDSDTITLIDTSALSRNAAQNENLRNQISALKPNYRFVVLSALMRSGDIHAYAKAITAVEPTHFIFSELDLTDRWGGIFSAHTLIGKSLAFTSNTPGGIGALMVPDVAVFVKQLLDSEASRG